jgi:hypothetical protein
MSQCIIMRGHPEAFLLNSDIKRNHTAVYCLSETVWYTVLKKLIGFDGMSFVKIDGP